MYVIPYVCVYFRAADEDQVVSAGCAVVGGGGYTLLLHTRYMHGYPVRTCNNGGSVVRVRELPFDTHSECLQGSEPCSTAPSAVPH